MPLLYYGTNCIVGEIVDPKHLPMACSHLTNSQTVVRTVSRIFTFSRSESSDIFMNIQQMESQVLVLTSSDE